MHAPTIGRTTRQIAEVHDSPNAVAEVSTMTLSMYIVCILPGIVLHGERNRRPPASPSKTHHEMHP